MDPKSAGKTGAYFSVLNAASEWGCHSTRVGVSATVRHRGRGAVERRVSRSSTCPGQHGPHPESRGCPSPPRASWWRSGGILARSDGPGDDVAGVDVDHDVEVVTDLTHRGAKLRNIPRPNLPRPGRQQLGLLPSPGDSPDGRGFTGQVVGAQHPVHRGHRAQVGALVEQRGPRLRDGLVGEPWLRSAPRTPGRIRGRRDPVSAASAAAQRGVLARARTATRHDAAPPGGRGIDSPSSDPTTRTRSRCWSGRRARRTVGWQARQR